MRHIPQEYKYLIIYKRLRSFICRMLLIHPGLYFFIPRNRLLIETYLGTNTSQIQKLNTHITSKETLTFCTLINLRLILVSNNCITVLIASIDHSPSAMIITLTSISYRFSFLYIISCDQLNFVSIFFIQQTFKVCKLSLKEVSKNLSSIKQKGRFSPKKLFC